MALPGKPTQKGITSPSYPLGVVVIGTQIGCITLAIVLASVFGGIWIDKLIGTKFIFTFLLVIVSAPLSLFLTFKIAMRSMKNITKSTELPPSPNRKGISDQEEEE